MQAARRVLRIASTALMVVAIALAVALVGVRLVGLTPYAVLSGSMEPTYHVGSVVYVKACEPLELKEGDPVTFMLDEDTLATHRIVQVVPDEEDPSVVRFQTQGDANDAPDGSLVHCNNVVGTPVFTVPCLGYVADYVQGPPGCYVAIAVCAVIVMLTFLPDLFAKEEEPVPSRHPERRRAAPGSKDLVRREAQAALRQGQPRHVQTQAHLQSARANSSPQRGKHAAPQGRITKASSPSSTSVGGGVSKQKA